MARSNLACPAQIVFFGLHATGTVFGLAYNSKTPDLYPNNSHHKLGWVLTGIAVFQFVPRILKRFSQSTSLKTIPGASYEQQPLVSSSEFLNGFEQPRGDDHPEATGSTRRPCFCEDETSPNGTDSQTLYDVALPPRSVLGRHSRSISWIKRWSNVAGSHRIARIVDIVSNTSHAVLIILAFILAFVTICTGMVTMAGIFVSLPVLSLWIPFNIM